MFRDVSDRDLEAIAREVVLGTFGPGELIMCPHTPRNRVFVVKEGMVRLFHRGPDGRAVTAEVVGRGHIFGTDSLFGAGTARTRLEDALARLARDVGETRRGGGRRLPAAATHEALAREIGVRRETVSRLLRVLEAEGLLGRDGGRIVVADVHRPASAPGLSDAA